MISIAADSQCAGRFYAHEVALSTARSVKRCSRLLSTLGVLALTLSSPGTLKDGLVFAQTQKEWDRELSAVESWFRGKSLAQITSTLQLSRPATVSKSDKAILMRNLPLVGDDSRVRDQGEIDHLQARLAGTLKYFARDQVLELIIIRHQRPIVYSKPGVVLVISTETLKLVDRDDAALVGIVAHELAHEYVAIDLLEALESKNSSRIRELELFCDAIGVIVMLDLQLDPGRYARVLELIITHSQESAMLNNGENSHPTLSSRLRVISDITEMFTYSPRAGRTIIRQ